MCSKCRKYGEPFELVNYSKSVVDLARNKIIKERKKQEENQVFLFQRRAVVEGRSIWQTLVGPWLYPWMYSCTNDSIRNENLKRLVSPSLKDLASRLNSELEEDKRESGLIIFNPNYKDLFHADGSHSDVWTIHERGVKQDIAGKFSKHLGGNWIVRKLG